MTTESRERLDFLVAAYKFGEINPDEVRELSLLLLEQHKDLQVFITDFNKLLQERQEFYKKKGQSVTPEEIAKRLLSCLDPSLGSRLLDVVGYGSPVITCDTLTSEQTAKQVIQVPALKSKRRPRK